MQRARGAYFVNRHGTFWKELNFNFPEHQKILKSIKNSLRKSKKPEIFSKIFDFSENRKIFIFFRKNQLKIVLKIQKMEFLKISKFRKFMDFFKSFSDFFNFLIDFLMDFKKF